MLHHLCYLTLLLLLSSFSSYAQNKRAFINKTNLPKFREEFEAFVNINGDTIKSGYYYQISERHHNENQLLMKGFYDNNLAHGLWQIYGAKGKFQNGKRVGIWSYSNFLFLKPNSNFSIYGNGSGVANLLQEYDHDKDILLINRESPEKYQECLDFTTLRPIILDKLPILIGSLHMILWYSFEDIRVPMQAIKNKIDGTVKYGLKIDEQGNVTDVILIKKLGYGCDETVIEAVKKHIDKFKFIPAHKNGKNIRICLVCEFRFKLV